MAAYYITLVKENHPCALLPAVTYIATVNAFLRAGWIVRLCDCDEYGVIDWNKLEEAAHFHLVAVVGLFGVGVRDTAKHSWPHKFNPNVTIPPNWFPPTIVIEDAAQHWLADDCERYRSSALSFDPLKNFASYGNGGAVVTNDLDLANFVRSWRNNGKPDHLFEGSNARMSESECAQMLVKAQYIDEWQKRRKAIARYWIDRFNDAGIRTLIDDSNIEGHGLQKFIVDIDNRDKVYKELNAGNIEVKIHYEKPLHEMGVFQKKCYPPKGTTAKILCQRHMGLPFYPELTDLETEYVADRVIECVHTNK